MNIYAMDLRRSLKSVLIWTLSTAAVFAFVISMYPAMLKSDFIAVLEEKLKLVPKGLLEALNMSGEDIRQLPSFFAWIFQFVLMAACLNGAMLGINALAREQNEGTIEFLCAKPVRRTGIVSAKLAAACTEYTVYYAFLTIAGMAACICVKPPELAAGEMISRLGAAVLGGFFAGLTYVFFGFMLSVFLKRAKAAAPLATAVFFLTYILGMLPSLGLMGFLKWISPINYFTPSRAVAAGGIDWGNALVCFAVMAACAGVAYAVYRRKDLAV